MEYITIEDNGVVTGVKVGEKGMPMVRDEGKEFELDAIHLFSKIPSLQTEAKEHRLKKEEALKNLAPFEGMDAEAAKEALEKVKTLDESQMMAMGDVEKLKVQLLKVETERQDEIRKNYEIVLGERDATIIEMQGDIYKAVVSSQFSKSNWFTGTDPKTILTPDIAEAYFGRNFKVDKIDDKLTVIGYVGEDKVYSKERPGELAHFDEAIGVIINNYPMRENILNKAKGTGAPGSGHVRDGDKKLIASLPPAERLKAIHRTTAGQQAS